MTKNVPHHIGIIPDGNRRWARKRGLAIVRGHEEGLSKLRPLVTRAIHWGVEAITVWAFSTENWKRKLEVPHLMNIYEELVRSEKDWLVKQQVRVAFIGQFERLPRSLQEGITELIDATKGLTLLTLTLAISYGGHDEITKAVKEIVTEKIPAATITAETIAQKLETAFLPRPDLIIRTSGEQRLSGFLSWSSAYAELYFPSCYWPDFDEQELDKAILWYQERERRFGK